MKKSWSNYVAQMNELTYAESYGADDDTLQEIYQQATLSDPRRYVYVVTRWHKDLGLHEFVSVHQSSADAELAKTRDIKTHTEVKSFEHTEVVIWLVPIGTIPDEFYKQIIK